MKKITGIILAVIGIVTVAIHVIFKVNERMSAARSVSIIGGADGPTSIFIAGKIGGTSIWIGMFVGIVLLITGILIIIRKKG